MENENENKKIEELTETEIKSLLYDQIIVMEQTKNNIAVLQQELSKRKEK